MSCEAVRPLLHAYLDGELDLLRALEVERHLPTCPACNDAFQGIKSLQSALQTLLPRFEPPAALESRLRAALRQDPPRPWWRSTPFLALLIFLLLGAAVLLYLGPSLEDRRLAEEAAASSHRSQQDGREVDFPSTDPEKLKAWFKAKLLFAPPVLDLRRQDFDLIGGRLDHMDHREAATVVYRSRGHTLQLLVWPTTAGTNHVARTATSGGYHMVHWSQGGQIYWAVSDIDTADLRRFADLVRKNSPGYCPP